jgi:MYXO-CTERM domain-containing protein
MHVKAMGDCEVSKVEVNVAPQVLRAVGVTPPYDWDLTNISGRQTISVTATDTRGQTSTTTITVNAPVDSAPADGMGNTGCSVGGHGRTSPLGMLPFGVAAFALVVRRRR